MNAQLNSKVSATTITGNVKNMFQLLLKLDSDLGTTYFW